LIRKTIAQLICISADLTGLNNEKKEQLKNHIKEYQWGGIFLFNGDVVTASELIDELQLISDIPLFVCSDLENGAGEHFRGATILPSNMAIAATGELDNAYKAGKITAQEAKEIGVNVIFAPSVDINNNSENPIINTRSFGDNPSYVADMAQAFIKGCQIEGVIATAKHFPGHGDTKDDSHIKLPVIKKTKKVLEKNELYPFKQVIEDDVAAVMSAHILVPSLDNNCPATVSKKIISELLREEFGFQGLIFTDALTMNGIKQGSNTCIDSLLAGCDVLLIPPSPENALEEIVEAVNTNKIPFEVVNTAYERILKYKKQYCNVNYEKNLKRINTEKNKNFSAIIARNALTKIKSTVLLPLNQEQINNSIHIILDCDNDSSVWNLLACSLKKNFNITSIAVFPQISEEKLEAIEEKINDRKIIIISYFSKVKAGKESLYPDNKLITWLQGEITDKTPVLISFSSPYIIKKFNMIKDYYCTYSESYESQETIKELLFKSLNPTGKCPVKLD
jgi:beta-N-acetylhexosaminidase